MGLPVIIIIYILLLIRSNPSSNQRYYMAGGGGFRRGKTGKYGEVGVKRNWWVLVQPPYFLQGNGKQSPRVELWNKGDRPPDIEENPGSHYRQMLGG